ncbi:MAG TPA: proline racemase family protein [Burkholderiales bacterium]|nr:proline racemase family protein [Burkholderiales bacterium]
MKRLHQIDVIYTHTEGEPTCIIHSGIRYPAGTSILEKRRYLEREYDWLRRALMQEPRGHRDMYGVFVTPPSSADADAGIVWIDATQYSHMCGHGTIGLSMALVAAGIMPRTGDITRIRYETTAGPVTAEVSSTADRVESCRFENVASFVAERGVPVELPGYGRIEVDIAFGGNYFVQVDWRGREPRIDPANGSELSRLGLAIREQVNAKVKLRHPTQSHITDVNYLTFYHEPTLPGARYKCVHVFSGGQLDRSPGGTGTCAMMALLESRGEMRVGDTIRSEGLLGSGTFEGTLLRETQIGGRRALVPSISGKANITGYAKWVFDETDPVSAGFLVS